MISQPQDSASAGASVTAEELELQCIEYIQCIQQIKRQQAVLFELRAKEAELNHRLFNQFGPRPVQVPIAFDGALWSIEITDRFGEYHRVTRMTGLDEIAPSNGVEMPQHGHKGQSS